MTRKGFSALRVELRGRSRSQRKSVFRGLIEDFSHIRLLIVVIPQIGELALAVAVSVLRVVSQFPARLVHVLSCLHPFRFALLCVYASFLVDYSPIVCPVFS